MISRKLKTLALCTMLCSNLFATHMKEMDAGPYVLFLGATWCITGTILRFLNIKRSDKKRRPAVENIDSTIFGWWLLSGFASACYDYPFSYPIKCIESGTFWMLRNSWKAAEAVVSAPLYFGSTVINSAKKLDSNFMWGTTCLGLAAGSIYLYRKWQREKAENEKLKNELIIAKKELHTLQQPGGEYPQPFAPPAQPPSLYISS